MSAEEVAPCQAKPDGDRLAFRAIFWGCPRLVYETSCQAPSIYSEHCCVLAQDAYIKTETRFFQKITARGGRRGHSTGDWNSEYWEAHVKKTVCKLEQRICPVFVIQTQALPRHVRSPCSTLWWSWHACAALGVLAELLTHRVLARGWRTRVTVSHAGVVLVLLGSAAFFFFLSFYLLFFFFLCRKGQKSLKDLWAVLTALALGWHNPCGFMRWKDSSMRAVLFRGTRGVVWALAIFIFKLLICVL